MKSVILSLLILVGFQSAMADSLHPCTPMEKAPNLAVGCIQGGIYYSIEIERMVSRDLEMCKGSVEYKTAKVRVSKLPDLSLIADLVILNGNFEVNYVYDNGTVDFKVPALNLDLKKCVSPQDGGFSIGN